MKFKERVRSFLAGRYGPDKFGLAILLLSLVISVLQSILSVCVQGVGGWITRYTLIVLSWALLGIFIFRLLSRNTGKRWDENERYLKLTKPVRNALKLQKNKWKDRKTHVYRKCPQKGCGAVVRLPKQKGTHTVRCPKCGNRFETRI